MRIEARHTIAWMFVVLCIAAMFVIIMAIADAAYNYAEEAAAQTSAADDRYMMPVTPVPVSGSNPPAPITDVQIIILEEPVEAMPSTGGWTL